MNENRQNAVAEHIEVNSYNRFQDNELAEDPFKCTQSLTESEGTVVDIQKNDVDTVNVTESVYGNQSLFDSEDTIVDMQTNDSSQEYLECHVAKQQDNSQSSSVNQGDKEGITSSNRCSKQKKRHQQKKMKREKRREDKGSPAIKKIKVSSDICYHCGEIGHIKFTCPKKKLQTKLIAELSIDDNLSSSKSDGKMVDTQNNDFVYVQKDETCQGRQDVSDVIEHNISECSIEIKQFLSKNKNVLDDMQHQDMRNEITKCQIEKEHSLIGSEGTMVDTQKKYVPKGEANQVHQGISELEDHNTTECSIEIKLLLSDDTNILDEMQKSKTSKESQGQHQEMELKISKRRDKKGQSLVESAEVNIQKHDVNDIQKGETLKEFQDICNNCGESGHKKYKCPIISLHKEDVIESAIEYNIPFTEGKDIQEGKTDHGTQNKCHITEPNITEFEQKQSLIENESFAAICINANNENKCDGNNYTVSKFLKEKKSMNEEDINVQKDPSENKVHLTENIQGGEINQGAQEKCQVIEPNPLEKKQPSVESASFADIHNNDYNGSKYNGNNFTNSECFKVKRTVTEEEASLQKDPIDNKVYLTESESIHAGEKNQETREKCQVIDRNVMGTVTEEETSVQKDLIENKVYLTESESIHAGEKNQETQEKCQVIDRDVMGTVTEEETSVQKDLIENKVYLTESESIHAGEKNQESQEKCQVIDRNVMGTVTEEETSVQKDLIENKVYLTESESIHVGEKNQETQEKCQVIDRDVMGTVTEEETSVQKDDINRERTWNPDNELNNSIYCIPTEVLSGKRPASEHPDIPTLKKLKMSATCYLCGESGHKRFKCPNNNGRNKRKRDISSGIGHTADQKNAIEDDANTETEDASGSKTLQDGQLESVHVLLKNTPNSCTQEDVTKFPRDKCNIADSELKNIVKINNKKTRWGVPLESAYSLKVGRTDGNKSAEFSRRLSRPHAAFAKKSFPSNIKQDQEETYGLNEDFLKHLQIRVPLTSSVSVKNLHEQVTESKLREVFGIAGHVVSVVMQDYSSPSATIQYEQPVEAVQAISMLHGQKLFGKTMNVHPNRWPNKNLLLPEGLSGVGMGLGRGGRPLHDVWYLIELVAIKQKLREVTNQLCEQKRQETVAEFQNTAITIQNRTTSESKTSVPKRPLDQTNVPTTPKEKQSVPQRHINKPSIQSHVPKHDKSTPQYQLNVTQNDTDLAHHMKMPPVQMHVPISTPLNVPPPPPLHQMSPIPIHIPTPSQLNVPPPPLNQPVAPLFQMNMPPNHEQYMSIPQFHTVPQNPMDVLPLYPTVMSQSHLGVPLSQMNVLPYDIHMPQYSMNMSHNQINIPQHQTEVPLNQSNVPLHQMPQSQSMSQNQVQMPQSQSMSQNQVQMPQSQSMSQNQVQMPQSQSMSQNQVQMPQSQSMSQNQVQMPQSQSMSQMNFPESQATVPQSPVTVARSQPIMQHNNLNKFPIKIDLDKKSYNAPSSQLANISVSELLALSQRQSTEDSLPQITETPLQSKSISPSNTASQSKSDIPLQAFNQFNSLKQFIAMIPTQERLSPSKDDRMTEYNKKSKVDNQSQESNSFGDDDKYLNTKQSQSGSGKERRSYSDRAHRSSKFNKDDKSRRDDSHCRNRRSDSDNKSRRNNSDYKSRCSEADNKSRHSDSGNTTNEIDVNWKTNISDTLFFENLPRSVTEQALRKKMSELGEVTYVKSNDEGIIIIFKEMRDAERCFNIFLETFIVHVFSNRVIAFL